VQAAPLRFVNDTTSVAAPPALIETGDGETMISGADAALHPVAAITNDADAVAALAELPLWEPVIDTL
jgi:hypothetical protein